MREINFMTPFRVIYIIAVTGFSGELWASTSSNRVDTVANLQIEVMASPITDAEVVDADGANSAVIKSAQLERLGATDLPTALRQVPGVTISRYHPVGAYGGAQGGSVYIRGAGTARPGGEVKIYTDGVPRESGVWSHPLMDIAPIEFADQISVTKNPQPQNYAGTFGAVDIQTRRRRTPGHEAEVDLTYGRFNSLLTTASAGGKMDIFDYYAGLSYKYSEGQRAHSEAELRSYYGRVGWQLSPHDHLAYIYQHTDNWVRDPGPKGGIRPQRDQFDTKTHTHIVRFESEREHLRGYALVYYEDGAIKWHKDHLTDGNPRSPAGYSNTDWNNYGFRSSYDLILEKLTLSGSLDSWSEGGDTRNILESNNRRVWGYNGRFFTTAPYLGARYDFELNDEWKLTPSIGTRYYISSDFDNENAPCAALTLAHSEVLKIFISHARGVHYPGIYARGTSPATWQTLKAETMDTTEIGTQINIGEHTIHTALYRTSVEDRMDSTVNGLVNSGDMTAYGSELALHLYPDDDLSFFLGGNYSDPVDHPVSRLPELTLSAGASYRLMQYLRWNIDTQYVSSQYAYSMRSVEPDLEKLDDYLIINTKIALDIKAFSQQEGEIYIAIENLTGAHYEFFPDYPMPGIMWYTGIKLRF